MWAITTQQLDLKSRKLVLLQRCKIQHKVTQASKYHILIDQKMHEHTCKCARTHTHKSDCTSLFYINNIFRGKSLWGTTRTTSCKPKTKTEKFFLFDFLVNNNDCKFKTWFKIHYSAPNVENKPPLGILSTALLHGSIVKQQITEHTAMNVYEGDCLGETVDLKLWEEEVAESNGKR